MIRVSLEELVANEALMMGRPCRAVASHCAIFRDHDGIERECWYVVYDASTEAQGQTRWTTYVDGEQKASGIISATSSRPAPSPAAPGEEQDG